MYSFPTDATGVSSDDTEVSDNCTDQSGRTSGAGKEVSCLERHVPLLMGTEGSEVVTSLTHIKISDDSGIVDHITDRVSVVIRVFTWSRRYLLERDSKIYILSIIVPQ